MCFDIFSYKCASSQNKESCAAGFSTCAGSHKRHHPSPPQCDPRGAFFFICTAIRILIKKKTRLRHNKTCHVTAVLLLRTPLFNLVTKDSHCLSRSETYLSHQEYKLRPKCRMYATPSPPPRCDPAARFYVIGKFKKLPYNS